MKAKVLPVCYFPTTVLLIDDDAAYLQNLRLALTEDKVVYELFDNPKQALIFLNDEYQPDPFIQRAIGREEDNERGHHGLDIRIEPIHNEVYNPKRFDEISIIVIDQEMPGLKGLELCSALKNIGPVKKLMLTGEVDDKQAIEAFNNDLIQKFVNKEEIGFASKVNAAILQMQKQYFDDLSSLVIDSLVRDPASDGNCALTDPLFVDFFLDFCEKNTISEYYLTDEYGSFMLVDFKGNPSFLAVKTKDDMDDLYLTAETSDYPPTTPILQQLKDRELMLYTLSEEDEYTLPSDWQTRGFLHQASIFKGTYKTYYYAHVTNIKDYQVKKENILSFYQYLEKK